MPNHVRNVVRFAGAQPDIDKLLADMKSPDQEFDFNKIIPMPAELNVEDGTQLYDAIGQYLRAVNPANVHIHDPAYPKLQPQHFEMERALAEQGAGLASIASRFVDNDDPSCLLDHDQVEYGKERMDVIRKYGVASWYSWRIRAWGTKWNAYDIEFGQNEVSFDTAWSPPVPVIEALAAKYPAVNIDHLWAEEFVGSFAGQADYRNGQCIAFEEHEDDKDSFEKAFEVYGADAKDLGLVYVPRLGTYRSLDAMNRENAFSNWLPQYTACGLIDKRLGFPVAVSRTTPKAFTENLPEYDEDGNEIDTGGLRSWLMRKPR